MAESFFRESLQMALQLREFDKIAYLLDALAGLAVNRGDYLHAAHLLAAAESVWNTVEADSFRKTVEVMFPENERELRREWEATVQLQLAGEWEAIRQTAAGMTVGEAVAFALNITHAQ